MKTMQSALAHTFIVAISLAFAACGAGPDAQTGGILPSPTAAQPSPTPARSPVAVEIPPITDALTTDARYYAEDLGISLDEAVDRLRLQGAFGKLGAAVSENERETYGGHWIQHEPDYKVVFAFTRDGEQTIRPYVQGTILEDYVEVRTAEATLTELKATQREAREILDDLGVRADSGIDIKKGIVNLYLPQEEKDKLDTALAESGMKLPDRVETVIAQLAQPA